MIYFWEGVLFFVSQQLKNFITITLVALKINKNGLLNQLVNR